MILMGVTTCPTNRLHFPASLVVRYCQITTMRQWWWDFWDFLKKVSSVRQWAHFAHSRLFNPGVQNVDVMAGAPSAILDLKATLRAGGMHWGCMSRKAGESWSLLALRMGHISSGMPGCAFHNKINTYMFKSLLYEVSFCKQRSQILTKETRVTTWESGTGFIGHLSNNLPPSQLLFQGKHDLLPTAKFPFYPGIPCHPRILACGPLSFLQNRNYVFLPDSLQSYTMWAFLRWSYSHFLASISILDGASHPEVAMSVRGDIFSRFLHLSGIEFPVRSFFLIQ